MTLLARLRAAAKRLKTEIGALALAARDPRVPWPAKLLAAALVAYALSPLDLIPDPIPVLGQLDDLLILPLGIWLVLRLVPPAVMADLRARAALPAGGHGRWIAAGAIVALWLGCGWLIWHAFG